MLTRKMLGLFSPDSERISLSTSGFPRIFVKMNALRRNYEELFTDRIKLKRGGSWCWMLNGVGEEVRRSLCSVPKSSIYS